MGINPDPDPTFMGLNPGIPGYDHCGEGSGPGSDVNGAKTGSGSDVYGAESGSGSDIYGAKSGPGSGKYGDKSGLALSTHCDEKNREAVGNTSQDVFLILKFAGVMIW